VEIRVLNDLNEITYPSGSHHSAHHSTHSTTGTSSETAAGLGNSVKGQCENGKDYRKKTKYVLHCSVLHDCLLERKLPSVYQTPQELSSSEELCVLKNSESFLFAPAGRNIYTVQRHKLSFFLCELCVSFVPSVVEFYHKVHKEFTEDTKKKRAFIAVE
jgi:hypothetical protein